MIDYSQGTLFSTGPFTPIYSSDIYVGPKILGFNPVIKNSQLKFVPLRTILPISSDKLNSIIMNLISTILEIIKRDLETPNIKLDNILMLKDDYTMPFIFPNQDKTFARQCEQSLLGQFSLLCKQLGYDQDLINCDSLQKFQEQLLLKIGYEQDYYSNNSRLIKNNLNIGEKIETTYENTHTKLYHIEIPKYILNAPNSDQIVLKFVLQDREVYELREVEIIEEFDNNHLPFLYGYTRYSDILVLFLKKHDWTFDFIANEFYRKRQTIEPKQIEQAFLRLYQQMIEAIKYMHSEGIIHRDIKPENIMFDKSYPEQKISEIINKPVNCVMIDFDRSIIVEAYNPENNTHYEGTLFFRPPEGEQIQYNQSYDIWQLGFMWLVIQKDFYQPKSQIYKQFQQMQNEIHQFNNDIKKEENKMNEDKEKLKIEGRLEQEINRIKVLKNQRIQKYNSLIEQIRNQNSFVTYNPNLQEIILKMINIDPQKRVTLDQVSAVIDSLIQ